MTASSCTSASVEKQGAEKDCEEKREGSSEQPTTHDATVETSKKTSFLEVNLSRNRAEESSPESTAEIDTTESITVSEEPGSPPPTLRPAVLVKKQRYSKFIFFFPIIFQTLICYCSDGLNLKPFSF